MFQKVLYFEDVRANETSTAEFSPVALYLRGSTYWTQTHFFSEMGCEDYNNYRTSHKISFLLVIYYFSKIYYKLT